MALDVSRRDQRTVAVPAARHRRRAVALLAVALFQLWMWGTRLWNMVREPGDFSAAFVGVHVALFTAGIATGVVLATIGVGMLREQRGRS